MSGTAILYVSSAIGLGHVTRDLTIASELRRLDPGLRIEWLAAEPAATVLRDAGERLLPESAAWRGTTGIAESCMHDCDIDLVRYAWRSLPRWLLNAWLFRRVLRERSFDAAVGDEAFDVDVPLAMRLLRPRVPFVMIFDFVGLDAMPGKRADAVLAWPLDAVWTLDGGVYGKGRHSAIFLGELEDIPAAHLGWGLPTKREHARKHYEIVGHAVPHLRLSPADRAAARRRFGFGDEPVVVCSAGGTSLGLDLLQACAAAAAPLRKALPGARVVLVCGPRIPIDSVTAPEGVDVLGYVPRLNEMLACCDAAVVQCGGTTTAELVAAGTPFLYSPIEGHFEQAMIAERLERHRAGRRVSLASGTPESLAEAIAGVMRDGCASSTMPLDGAQRAARHILEAVGRQRG